jgi:hypothetical protein
MAPCELIHSDGSGGVACCLQHLGPRVQRGRYSWTCGPEDGNCRLLRKFRNYIGLQIYTYMTSGFRKFGSSSTQLRESRIS